MWEALARADTRHLLLELLSTGSDRRLSCVRAVINHPALASIIRVEGPVPPLG
jgi:ABC-type ATPase involved in cell division